MPSYPGPSYSGGAELEILHETPDWVAVNKPAGLATIPGRGGDDCILWRLGRQLHLPAAGSADPRLRIVHRLDKETSGVLLMAKHAIAQRHLSEQFRQNAVKKEYLAIVVGRPDGAEGMIDAALAPHPKSARHMAVVRHGGKPAKTAWKVEEIFRSFCLLRAFPLTGRTHQIRVHLRHIGLPLLIDALYRPVPAGQPSGLYLSQLKSGYRPAADRDERPLIDRLTLHAERLTFSTLTGEPITLTAPLHKDFRAALNQLRRLGR